MDSVKQKRVKDKLKSKKRLIKLNAYKSKPKISSRMINSIANLEKSMPNRKNNPQNDNAIRSSRTSNLDANFIYNDNHINLSKNDSRKKKLI